MKKYIKELIGLINEERKAEMELMINEIKKLSSKKKRTARPCNK